MKIEFSLFENEKKNNNKKRRVLCRYDIRLWTYGGFIFCTKIMREGKREREKEREREEGGGGGWMEGKVADLDYKKKKNSESGVQRAWLRERGPQCWSAESKCHIKAQRKIKIK